MTKMTYVDALNLAISNLSAQDAIYDGANTVPADATIDKLTALRDTLVKRASAPRKPSKADLAKAEADAVLIDRITDLLSDGTQATCKEIAESLGDVSIPKVAALLRKMGAHKDDSGRTPLFSLTAPEADADGEDWEEIPEAVEA